ncbi:MAG: hypothetical protein CMJ49_13640 [Planctomycetaceae bacterium]|nr:hypothetical protein [Planctomycetaceae bacterium]
MALAASVLGDTTGTAPDWLEGYRVRFPVRVVSDAKKLDAKTIIVRIPTGGWLKPDATDIRVCGPDGGIIPAIVLAHDPLGDTIIQFRQESKEERYWVYVSNPDAPGKDLAFEARVSTAKEASIQAGLLKMRLAKVSAENASALRDLLAEIGKQQGIFDQASTNLATWQEALPKREAEHATAKVLVPPAKTTLDQAAAAHAPFQKIADEKTALSRAASTKAKRAQAAAARAAQAHNAAIGKLNTAQQKLAADPAPSEQETAELNQRIADLKSALPELEAVVQSTAAAAVPLEAEAAAAKQVATDARLAAAPTDTTLKQARTQHTQLSNAAKQAAARVAKAKNVITSESKLKADAQAALAKLQPTLPGIKKAATDSKTASDNAVTDARAKEATYFDLAAAVDPRLLKEGLTVEFREWSGDKFADWAQVVEGLQCSDNVLGGAVVTEVIQNVNPFRRADPRNFAASYRGYLKVDKPGVYSFFVNGDDATFLFINGYKVYSRTGTNPPLRGRVELYGIGADIQLERGVHPFEVHHVIGNTAEATGHCTLMWLTPNSKAWQWVPRTAFTAAHIAVPVGVEAWDGQPIAVFDYGIDDVLTVDGVSLFLTRFAAAASPGVSPNVTWSFDDGTTSQNPSPTHIFFKEGDVVVTLQSHPTLPAFRRRCHVWTPPVPTNPLAIGTAVEMLSEIDVTQLQVRDLNDIYHFLRLCEQPDRWPVMERVCDHLLAQPELDVKYRALLYGSLIEAIARQGRGTEAVKIFDRAVAEIGSLRTLDGAVRLDTAYVQRQVLKDYAAAGKLYAQVIQGNERLRHPLIRQAAVAWGDMYLDAGDLARAGEAYRLARQLGSIGAVAGGKTDAVKRGALLRVAEQQLTQGNIEQTYRLLWRIENEFPEQKLEGLYRYMRAESDRHAGRYDQAIRNYEMLLNLRQWGGFRPQAFHGIADCYYRMGDSDEALKWLTALQESYPNEYQQRDLDSVRARIETRRSAFQQQQAADTGGDAAVQEIPTFSDRHVNYEQPDDVALIGSQRAGPIPALGFDGPHVVTALRPGFGYAQVANVSMVNLPPQGNLWLEMWYRTRGTSAHDREMIIVKVAGDDAPAGVVSAPPQRTFGLWHKIVLESPALNTFNGSFAVFVPESAGILEIDGVRVRHVSDRQHDALRRFVQGADPQ